MAPINLENNIREKLENRELNPSADAWKKLESQLDKNGQNRNQHRKRNRNPNKLESQRDKNRSKRKMGNWYYLAASLVGLLLAVSVFLNRNTIEIENKVVTEPTVQNAIHSKGTEIVTELSNPYKKKESSEKSKIGDGPTAENPKPESVQKKMTIEKKMRKAEALAAVSEQDNPIDPERLKEEPIINEDPVFNAKADEVVASVKSFQQRDEKNTVEEVETLLDNARRKIQAEKILRNQKVDATALLEDVEWELERDFRDKIFDVLGEGFNKLRTAISQRND